ncbi:MAG: hypothetical protein COB02_03165 [Candidatus Cloacimonadota bacterium]|nr:MAG: hypothetical protein COB02_03165 [Candidatus Cloacimonadota bacterium]
MKKFIFFIIVSLLVTQMTQAKAPEKSSIQEIGDKVKINLSNTDINAVIKYLAKFSGEHYLKDPTVKGKINIVANKPVTRKEAVIILEQALIFNQFSIVKHGLAKYVIPTRFAKQYGMDITVGNKGVHDIKSANMEMRFFKLDHIGVRKMNSIANSIIGRNGQIIAHPEWRMLQIIDSSFGLQRIANLIEKMDKPDTILEMYLVHLQNTKAAKTINTLKSIFNKNLTFKSSPNIIEADEDRINYIADARTNTIIVVCHPKYIEQIRETVRILDQEMGEIKETRFYYIKHAEADTLSKQLLELFPKDAMKIISDERTNSLLFVAQSSRVLDAAVIIAAKLDRKFNGEASDIHVYYLEHADAKEMSDLLVKLFDKNQKKGVKKVSIVPDEATNSLVITASKGQYDEIKDVIKRLDIFRAQVLVEALIVEVSQDYLRDIGFDMGVIQSAAGDKLFMATNLGVRQKIGDTGTSIGFADSTINSVEDAIKNPLNIGALLKAVKTSSRANVLASPQILTKDNQEANIIVGEVVPLPSGVNQGVNNGNFTVSNFRFEDVGINLKIKPRISQKKTVSLEVDVEIKSRSSDSLFAFDIPIITKRAIQTVVSTKDGETIVLGGLIQESKSESLNEVPLLSKIPFLGKLFRSKTKRREKNNLFIFLTPYILTNEEEVVKLTDHFNGNLKNVLDDGEAHPMSFKDGSGLIRDALNQPKIDIPTVQRITRDGFLEPLSKKISQKSKVKLPKIKKVAKVKVPVLKIRKVPIEKKVEIKILQSVNKVTSKIEAPKVVLKIETPKILKVEKKLSRKKIKKSIGQRLPGEDFGRRIGRRVKKLPRTLQVSKLKIKKVEPAKMVKKKVSKLKKNKKRKKTTNRLNKRKRKSRPSLMSSIRKKLARLKSKRKRNTKKVSEKKARKIQSSKIIKIPKRKMKIIVKKGRVIGDANAMVVKNSSKQTKSSDSYERLIESLKRNIKSTKNEETKNKSIDQDFDSLIHQIKDSLKNDKLKKE